MILIAILFGPAGCAQNIVENSYCLIYQPVYFSDDDTEETVKQLMKNNASYESVCNSD